MGLCLKIKKGERFRVGEMIIKVDSWHGGQVKLFFEGPKDVKVDRVINFKNKIKPGEGP